MQNGPQNGCEYKVWLLARQGALRYNKEKVDKDETEVLFWQKMLEPFDKHGQMDIDACMDSFLAVSRSQPQNDQCGFPCFAEIPRPKTG